MTIKVSIASLLCWISYVASCSVSIANDLGKNAPLLLKPNGGNDHTAFYYPDGDGDTINLTNGNIIQVACPGGRLIIDGAPYQKTIDNAVCNGNNLFTINSKSVPFKDIRCDKYPKPTTKYPEQACFKNNTDDYKKIEIGFDIPNLTNPLSTDDRFIKLIDICFDKSQANVLYSRYHLKHSNNKEVNVPNPSQWNDGKNNIYFDVPDVNFLYTENNQKDVLSILGNAAFTEKNKYLARGHLTPKTGFFYGAQQRLTFSFMNAAPQWQGFNCGKWFMIENRVKDFAASKKVDLEVITGTYGVLTVKQTELFLYDSVKKGKKLPLPMLFWKVLYKPQTDAGVVFLGVNGLWLNPSGGPNDICPDICKNLPWLPQNMTDEYTRIYCCDVNEFKKKVHTLPPDIIVTQLLN